MKTLFVITPHSFIDVITNSSTELFVCDTDKTIEIIEEILKADPNIYGYQKPWIFNLKEYREWRNKEKEKEKHERDWVNKFNYLEGWFYDIENEEDLEELRKDYIERGDNSGNYWSLNRNPFSQRINSAIEKAQQENPGNWEKTYEARKEVINEIYEETKKLKEKPDWWINPHKYSDNTQTLNDLDGKIILIGTDDNSIPYDHFDWIENTFNATRHHLG